MTREEALEALSFHSGHNEAVDDPRWTHGFLGQLRPYAGRLDPDAFVAVMRAICVLAGDLEQPRVPRQLVASIFGMAHLARMWGVHAEGALRRDRLISDADAARLEAWVDTIVEVTTRLLDEGASALEDFADEPWAT